MKRRAIIFITLSLILILSGCSKSINSSKKDNVNSHNKMKIYTTVFAFQSFTEQIGGKYVDVESIYPPGADLHSYEPTQKDMINIAKSDLFIYSSDDLDPVSAKITQSMENKNMKLALASDLNQKELIHSDDHDEDEGHNHAETENDPHVWLDPVLDRIFAEKIKDKLIQKDPKHKSYYEKNYKKLDKDIANIDKKMQKITKSPKREKIIISHDSLGYLTHRYHFKQEGVNGMNDEEPSQKKILSIVKNIKNSKSPYVLYEQNITSKITDVIKRETDTQPLSFHNLAVLTKKEKDNQSITYQSLMKKDIESLDKALNQ
ncbi:metal ABC transporter solute-binding protein, Zn/Mn family [Staphylococcus capitis]|uniref:metal ABC transporter solute-binding protein, Zn/Mn family n=1 Tax=Staphylococcus capitis TaxID=29388 RepID=UPI00064B7E03|nr:zinc ABC transporter substrate-binding protein [Staphylococcus capitis]AKL92765.1 putative zinc transport system zinc-binding lipoprotein AdcA precursor [Staphylococcus capitis subsp. capitis]MCC0829743.1 zinc ABC transporter substrate-binding protein [Staphylococcus capitis]MCC3743805.1 zinc ABC transporter substrate-binding protein [Staphylococcus capitis]MDS0929969.1 zinc ABC transporter substrate-binding protein [Staphylococcus capitis]NMK81450.1 zinc ABC transporter solute-binding prot